MSQSWSWVVVTLIGITHTSHLTPENTRGSENQGQYISGLCIFKTTFRAKQTSQGGEQDVITTLHNTIVIYNRLGWTATDGLRFNMEIWMVNLVNK